MSDAISFTVRVLDTLLPTGTFANILFTCSEAEVAESLFPVSTLFGTKVILVY
jgi:hypothetical protein